MNTPTASVIAPVIIADLSPVELRGLYQGIFGSSWGLVFFNGPLAGGWIFEHLGKNTLWCGCLGLKLVLSVCYLLMRAPAKRRMAQTWFQQP